jgi:hypothetical protein
MHALRLAHMGALRLAHMGATRDGAPTSLENRITRTKLETKRRTTFASSRRCTGQGTVHIARMSATPVPTQALLKQFLE